MHTLLYFLEGDLLYVVNILYMLGSEYYKALSHFDPGDLFLVVLVLLIQANESLLKTCVA